MELTKRQAASLLNDCSINTLVVGGGEDGEELSINNKLGVVLLSHGITPHMLGYNSQKENTRKAGQLLKEWGELLLSEEKEGK